LIKLSADSQLSTSAIQALTRMPDLAALDIYLDGLVSKNAAVRSQCKTAVTSLRDAGLPRIEARLASTNGLPDDAIASLREIYQHDTAAKRGRLFKVKVKPVPEYQSFALAHPGNARHGQSIFSDANGVNCVKCHAINGQGGHIGPELTGLGARQTRPQIIESVLYPSKVILDGYQQILFYMTDDEDYSGIVRSETADTVMVIDSLGVTNLLEKSKIKSRKISQISLMPEGLQTGLSLQDFSDLIAFVENSGAGMPQRNPGDMAARPPGPEPLPPDPMDFLNMSPSPLAIPAAPAMPAASMMPPEPIPGPHPHGRRGPVNPLAPPMPPGFPVPPKPPQQRLNNPPAASTFRGL
jgi:putative heme-binding domain-containing protein